jgi:hypothetical protein
LFFELAEAVVKVVETIIVVRQLIVVLCQPLGSVDLPALIVENRVTLVDEGPEIERSIPEPTFLVLFVQVFDSLGL